MGEFNLSEKIEKMHTLHTFDVKEFIKRLKERLEGNNLLTEDIGKYGYPRNVIKLTDKLAGPKLI